MLGNILTDINIVGDSYSFGFERNEMIDLDVPNLLIKNIEILDANKAEANYFKNQNFIVFANRGIRNYFIDSYWEDSELILEQLKIVR
ncbi:hypothetical protein ABIB40_003324 [Pedobacter sp. UYP30]|uniref:hypothetical protein n=1 Tax=Pedobacter sp. UYP30 TaxID=1756400 RepID=UPI003398FD93